MGGCSILNVSVLIKNDIISWVLIKAFPSGIHTMYVSELITLIVQVETENVLPGQYTEYAINKWHFLRFLTMLITGWDAKGARFIC